ncbi:MAG TPA: alkaline phosphatase D family protein, partial [Rhodothermales bacterium]|nr:alkaline phosphatase D family protein [Rhodothermales bacterium]
PFKLVGIGGQVLPTDEMPGSETYATIAPHERQYLLDEIARRGIEGVVLVSGDVHHTELMRLDRPGTYPLYEFTSSPLTAAAAPPQYARVNSLTVEGTFVQGQRNFGTLTVTGPRTARVLTMRTYDTDGVLLWEHEVAASDLRTPSADR